MTNYQPAIVCFISCVAWPVAVTTSIVIFECIRTKKQDSYDGRPAFFAAILAYAWLITSWLHF